MNNTLNKIYEVLNTCHPDSKKTIELDYYELSKIYSALKAQELYNATMEKCLMDGFAKMDDAVPIGDDIKTLNEKFFASVDKSIKDKLTMKYGEVIESSSNDEYIKSAEESNKKIESEPNYMNTLLKKYGRNK